MANIKVNKQQWEALTAGDRTAIENGLKGVGIIKGNDSIVVDTATPPFDGNSTLEPLSNPLTSICKAACDATAAEAVKWCTTNTSGIALAACIAVAESARGECHKLCP